MYTIYFDARNPGWPTRYPHLKDDPESHYYKAFFIFTSGSVTQSYYSEEIGFSKFIKNVATNMHNPLPPQKALRTLLEVL